MSEFWADRITQRRIEDVVFDAVISHNARAGRYLDAFFKNGEWYSLDDQKHYEYLIQFRDDAQTLLDQIRGAIGE